MKIVRRIIFIILILGGLGLLFWLQCVVILNEGQKLLFHSIFRESFSTEKPQTYILPEKLLYFPIFFNEVKLDINDLTILISYKGKIIPDYVQYVRDIYNFQFSYTLSLSLKMDNAYLQSLVNEKYDKKKILDKVSETEKQVKAYIDAQEQAQIANAFMIKVQNGDKAFTIDNLFVELDLNKKLLSLPFVKGKFTCDPSAIQRDGKISSQLIPAYVDFYRKVHSGFTGSNEIYNLIRNLELKRKKDSEELLADFEQLKLFHELIRKNPEIVSTFKNNKDLADMLLEEASKSLYLSDPKVSSPSETITPNNNATND